MSQAGHLRLRDITLSRIPHLRSFVNDALLDVLYFMSPAYHQVSCAMGGWMDGWMDGWVEGAE
jgi:hypothetical protein